MTSIIHHSGYSIPSVNIEQLIFYDYLMKDKCVLNKGTTVRGLNLDAVDGKLKNSRDIIEAATNAILDSNVTVPFVMKAGQAPSPAGISTSPFTYKYITDDMRTELVRPVEYSKPEDDYDIESESYTKRWYTDDILVYSDDSALSLIPNAKDKKGGRPDYNKREEYELLRDKLALAVESAMVRRGLRVNGITYHYFTTGSSGLKQGKHYFVSERLWKKCAGIVYKLVDLAVKANLPISKFLQYLALLLTDSNKMNLSDEFVKKGIVVGSIKDIMETKITCTMAVPDETNGKTNLVCSIMEDSYPNAWTDGAILANSDMAENCNKYLVQLRGFGIKGQMHFASFSRLAELSGLSDEQLVVQDIFGVKHDIRDVSFVLTKDSFKLLPLLLKGTYDSLYSFLEDFGFTDLYAVNVYNDNHFDNNETVNYTKQMMAAVVTTPDFIKEVAAKDFEDIKKYVDMPHEEFVPFVASLYEGRADKELISLDICDGAFAYTEDALNKVEEAYAAKFRNATQKWHINGHCLICFPDIIALFHAYLGIQHYGLCGNENAVYCPAYHNAKVMINRNPVIANDTAIQTNLYRKDNPWNEFLSLSVCYFGKMSVAPHQLGADYDGDKVNVTNNKVLIERVEATNAGLAMPPVKYSDMKDSQYIAETSLATFSFDAEKIAGCIVYAAKYSRYVGMSAARISNLFCELNIAVENNDIQKANDIYLYDICPNAIQEQWAVDASKTLAFYPWAFTGSKMGIGWYEDSTNSMMLTKEYKKVSSEKVSDDQHSWLEFSIYRSDAMYPVDAKGYEQCWFNGTNIGKMHDYFAKNVPARLFFTYEFLYGSNYDFDKDDFTVIKRYRTERFKNLNSRFNVDKSVFCNNWKPQPGCYKVEVSSKMVNIFAKYDISVDYKVDEEVVAKGLFGIYKDKSHSMSRYQKVDDMRTIYAEYCSLNRDAYLHLAREYNLGHITLSCFLETTIRKTKDGIISDAACFLKF